MTTSRDSAAGDSTRGDARIRPVERADLLGVFRIEKAVFAQPWPYAAFERLLDAPAFLVAEGGDPEDAPDRIDSGTVLGYVVGDVTPNHGRDIGHVKDIAVRPDAQGRGLGRRLLRTALTELAAAGASVVKLEVRESNHRAQELYVDEGFEPSRRVPSYYGDGEAAFVMRLDVGAWVRRRNAAGDADDGAR
ncbi:ribosomal protein S18-alanine N-acetyltransferase [Halobaculum sp. CBA1158]|uniref:ribosomal protein S18-alanine N-acetyltransferase n=1 Tax=Halobaculum sp. CBA1158 TaxID=2904243 RepID=UPI001F3192D2|nr:ribosomal protein S18-alanine N-acetyltransferase [Halobaculum sp. CBA1158]UIO99664.1 ribosomal protein S18-alanine N-acetyltransferase [Halobaculum sp. CBA1158]